VRISFIIASVDRDQQLQQCIASIERAHECRSDIAVEILVVIQKSKSPKVISMTHPDIVSIYYINELGLSVSRNYAIAKSTGDYLVFIDDDAAVGEDFIDILSNTVLKYDNVKVFCGKLFDPFQNMPFSHLFYNNEEKMLGRYDYKYFMGSAHVLSRDVVIGIGGYDERFGVGSLYYGSEESDIFFRLKASNEKVLYVPELVFHHPIINAAPRYVYNYAYAVGAMLTKNCINDKAFFFIYCWIVIEITIKASVRILQKMLLGGIYKDKDERYHYSALIKGTFKGINDFLSKELKVH